MSYLFFLIIAIACYYGFLYIINPIKPPKKTIFNIPEKIVFERTEDNNYNLGSLVLDTVTIGGHGRLKTARFNYESTYIDYANNFNYMVDAQKALNDSLNAVGTKTYKILRELDRSRRLLGKPASHATGKSIIPKVNTLSTQVSQLKKMADQEATTGIALIQGATVGGLAAVGTWTLVSLVGTASTGTAISSLSGIAAHNAILAWFGGGAIAAGGGGIASGTIVLGAITLVPIVIISSYKTHSSARELDIRTLQIKEETPKMIESQNEFIAANKLVNQQLAILDLQLNKLKEVNRKVYKIIYPYGVVSQVKRNINKVKNQDFYTKKEVEDIEQLLHNIDEIYEMFNNNTIKKTEKLL